MMQDLGLRDEDLDGVVYEQEEMPPVDSFHWTAIARVHVGKTYNQFWFFKYIRAAWYLEQDVKIRPQEDKLYTLHLFMPRGLGKSHGVWSMEF
jgi:hypothetical protein